MHSRRAGCVHLAGKMFLRYNFRKRLGHTGCNDCGEAENKDRRFCLEYLGKNAGRMFVKEGKDFIPKLY
jgi:hypothetical protein